MEPRSVFLETLGRGSIKILDFMMENYLFDYPKTRIRAEAKVSHSIFEVVFHRLIDAGVIKCTRKFRSKSLYQINRENKITKKLYEIEDLLQKSELKNS